MSKYVANRNLSAGRNKQGELIRFDKGGVYSEVPDSVKPYFSKVSEEEAKKAEADFKKAKASKES